MNRSDRPAAFKRGDLAEAERLYKALLPVVKNAVAKFGAQGDFQALREAEAEAGKILSNLSLLRYKDGDFSAALAFAERCVDSSPSWYRGHQRLGQARTKLGQHEEATMAFANALDAVAKDADLTAEQRKGARRACSRMLQSAERKAAAAAASVQRTMPSELETNPSEFVRNSGAFAALEGSSVLQGVYENLSPEELARLEATCRFFGSAVQGGRENLREPTRRRVQCVPLLGALEDSLQHVRSKNRLWAVAVDKARDAVRAYCACTDEAWQPPSGCSGVS